jgi:PIN domain nuclease of toxin-antitoxin system
VRCGATFQKILNDGWWPRYTCRSVVFLNDTKLSPRAFEFIDKTASTGAPAYISAISLIEVVYLVERGRIPADAFDRLAFELKKDNPAFKVVAVDQNISEALRNIPRHIVPDMPDRIIAATAVFLNVPLITRDRQLHSAGIPVIW